eukprot:CAMPEP_0197860412 /NCGR_PEP_ID=MMETSP1438-20131217/35756_1 /TAXON_ID=1461541 /ORGANISM="Pterosperma sp., Strain CCMP1384" /LENGTH=422 /DNA_ID=CAMNT_0043477261 /DNA_START=261 /DNA_END=1529 /DNA_ORIENTATION=+
MTSRGTTTSHSSSTSNLQTDTQESSSSSNAVDSYVPPPYAFPPETPRGGPRTSHTDSPRKGLHMKKFHSDPGEVAIHSAAHAKDSTKLFIPREETINSAIKNVNGGARANGKGLTQDMLSTFALDMSNVLMGVSHLSWNVNTQAKPGTAPDDSMSPRRRTDHSAALVPSYVSPRFSTPGSQLEYKQVQLQHQVNRYMSPAKNVPPSDHSIQYCTSGAAPTAPKPRPVASDMSSFEDPSTRSDLSKSFDGSLQDRMNRGEMGYSMPGTKAGPQTFDAWMPPRALTDSYGGQPSVPKLELQALLVGEHAPAPLIYSPQKGAQSHQQMYRSIQSRQNYKGYNSGMRGHVPWAGGKKSRSSAAGGFAASPSPPLHISTSSINTSPTPYHRHDYRMAPRPSSPRNEPPPPTGITGTAQRPFQVVPPQ